MTTPVSGRLFTSGARFGAVFPLDQNTGLIKNTEATADKATYGYMWDGIKGFNGTFPTPRKITHYGQDRVLQVDWLPPLEGIDANVNVSSTQFDLIAALTGVKVQTIGTSKAIQAYTNKQGFEPSVGLMFYQQAEDIDTGIRRWLIYLIASAKVTFQPASMTDANSDLTFPVVPAISKCTLLGTQLTEADNGTTTSQLGVMATLRRPYLCAWHTDGIETDFLFATDKQAADATDAHLVYTVDGVVTVPSTTPVTGPTFTPALAAGKTIIGLYEGA